MNNTNTGGPAFPLSTVDPYDRSVTTCDGMTLRDYFAAKAMEQIDWSNTGVTAGAETCFELADAMLKARNQ